jgi:hypothetical protein
MKLHIDYCAEYGLSKEDILNHEEKQGKSYGAALSQNHRRRI